MAQAGQTHRRQDGTRGKTQSANGASSHQKSGRESSSNGRAKNNGARSGAGQKSASASSRKTSTASSQKTQASSNGHNGRKSSGTKSAGSKSSGTKSSASASKSRPTAASGQRQSRGKQQSSGKSRSTQRSRSTKSSPQRSGQTRSRQSSGGLPTPDPRWGLVPLTTAGIGGATWVILRRRRRKRGLARLVDLDSARELFERELGDATQLAQSAGRVTSRLVRSRAKDAQSAAKSAGKETGRFAKSAGKETGRFAKLARKGTGRLAKTAGQESGRFARTAGKGTGRFLRRGAEQIQQAVPHRSQPTPAARLAQELSAQGQWLTSKAPSRAEDAWPLLLAALPGAAYTALQLKAGHRLPIQCSVDVAVPIEVAYGEWMQLEFLPEGSHCVTEIERTEDDKLEGTIEGPLHSIDWEAEILDERDGESFAWRSTSGSDCAGLITFHQLGERLTRLELQLDVLPVRSRDAIALSLHTADRQAEAQLRRFKARLETMSPDAYENGRETDETDQEETGREPDQTDQDEKED